MKLSDIKPGMEIKYRGRVYGHGNLMGKDKTKTGIIKQVTPNLIAVQGQRYPDTILVNDLLSGQVKIISLKGEGEMVKKLDWETLGPQIDELRAQGKTIKAIAEELGIGETTTQRYLANKKQTPTLEPEQAANQEPDEGEEESAEDIIPYSVERLENIGREINPDDTKIYVPERQNYTITQYNEQIKQGAVTVEDEEEPPYVVTFPEHHEIAWEIASLLDLKRKDYGTENIKKFGSYGVLVRVSDKVERLINLSKRNDTPNFESVEDTWRDIAGYAVLALIELREGR